MSRTDFSDGPYQRSRNPYDDVDRAYERRLREEAERPRRPDRRMIAGIGAACVLGIVGGFIMKPNMNDQPAAERVATRKVEAPTEPTGMNIVVDRTPLPEPVTPLGPPAPQTAPVEGYTPQPLPRTPIPRTTVSAPPAPQARPAPAPRRTATAPRQTAANGTVMRPYQDVVPQPRRTVARGTIRPSFNCRYARTESERMICIDPQLAAADRRLARAYHDAIANGVPERVLRRQQDVWLGARESAARYGPEDVARVYEARIAELRDMGRY